MIIKSFSPALIKLPAESEELQTNAWSPADHQEDRLLIKNPLWAEVRLVDAALRGISRTWTSFLRRNVVICCQVHSLVEHGAVLERAENNGTRGSDRGAGCQNPALVASLLKKGSKPGRRRVVRDLSRSTTRLFASLTLSLSFDRPASPTQRLQNRSTRPIRYHIYFSYNHSRGEPNDQVSVCLPPPTPPPPPPQVTPRGPWRPPNPTSSSSCCRSWWRKATCSTRYQNQLLKESGPELNRLSCVSLRKVAWRRRASGTSTLWGSSLGRSKGRSWRVSGTCGSPSTWTCPAAAGKPT